MLSTSRLRFRVCSLLAAPLLLSQSAAAQDVTSVAPVAFGYGAESAVCNNSADTQKACVKLGGSAFASKVDVFFLFDDTGSFAGFVPTVTKIFGDLATQLQTAFPGVNFAFGVGRFEDFGGTGNGFSGDDIDARPFTLNQPIVTAAVAGGEANLLTLINDALNRTAPGFGGDGPETALDALFQVATGVGFDANGDGSALGLSGTQTAGTIEAQSTPDNSGDVPPFSSASASVPRAGTVGGAGFRPDALRLVLLATDICSVAAFAPGTTVPATIVGSGSTELTSELLCGNSEGNSRFGRTSDSKDEDTNTVTNAVSPLGATTVQETINALNAAGIRVLGMGPGASPKPKGSGPSFSPGVLLSALARLTGGVDKDGNPLVFDLNGPSDTLRTNIVDAIVAAAKAPVDLSLGVSGTVPGGLTVSPDKASILDVLLGSEACFDVTFDGKGDVSGTFNIDFVAKPKAVDRSLPETTTPSDSELEALAAASTASLGGSVLASIPATITCKGTSCGSVSLTSTVIALDGGASRQKDLVVRAANKLRRAGGRASDVRNIIAQANALYEQMWLSAWSLDQNVNTCAATESCVAKSNASVISSYRKNAAALQTLLDKTVNKIRKLRGAKKLSKDESKLISQGKSRRDSNSKTALTVPTNVSLCSGIPG